MSPKKTILHEMSKSTVSVGVNLHMSKYNRLVSMLGDLLCVPLFDGTQLGTRSLCSPDKVYFKPINMYMTKRKYLLNEYPTLFELGRDSPNLQLYNTIYIVYHADP